MKKIIAVCCVAIVGFASELYMTADALWWRAENHGFSYSFNRTDPFSFTGKIIRLDPKWRPGFRIALGLNTNYDNWDLLINWTWYLNHISETRAQPKLTNGTSKGFYPLFPIDDGGTASYRTVLASWDLTYDTLDFEMGRVFDATKTLSMRPCWGIRGALLNQEFKDHFSSLLNVSDLNAMELSSQGKNDFWGVGPRVGSRAEWRLGAGVSILGNLAGSLLYGQTQVKTRVDTLQTIGGVFGKYQDYTEDFYQLVPTLQMMMGVQWGFRFHAEKRYFGLNLCWEANYWWNQFNVPIASTTYSGGTNYPYPTTGNQPVTMEGATLNAQLNF